MLKNSIELSVMVLFTKAEQGKRSEQLNKVKVKQLKV